jgi:hypothetical protein
MQPGTRHTRGGAFYHDSSSPSNSSNRYAEAFANSAYSGPVSRAKSDFAYDIANSR